jgi:hypothetical protein
MIDGGMQGAFKIAIEAMDALSRKSSKHSG